MTGASSRRCSDSNAQEPKSLRRTWREGFFVGATNPKGILIFTAILPQFIDRSQGHLTAQLLTLGMICVLIALISDGIWAVISGGERQWLGRSPKRLERLSAGGGVMLIGLGVGLAVTGRAKIADSAQSGQTHQPPTPEGLNRPRWILCSLVSAAARLRPPARAFGVLAA